MAGIADALGASCRGCQKSDLALLSVEKKKLGKHTEHLIDQFASVKTRLKIC